MTKTDGFLERLFDAVAARRGRPFQWGAHDCCLFACDVIRDAGGVDYAAPFRGRYRTAAGAARVLRRFAGGGLEAAAEKISRDNGLEEVLPLMAQRGDFVLVDETGGPALGVCLGSHIVAAGPAGAVLRSLAAARRAWRT
jgi:cell wall-associated NlpC family hydrolase